MRSARPVGFFLWGVAWLLMYLAVITLAGLIVYLRLTQPLAQPEPPDLGRVAIAWVLLGPLSAYLFVVAPWWMLSQAGLGFALSVQALTARYRDEKLARFVGLRAHKVLEARVESRATRFWTAVGAVGFAPGWLFVVFSVVITMGAFVMGFVAGPVGAGAGLVLIAGGVIGAGMGIRSTFKKHLVSAWPSDKPESGLTEKYYRGLRYREGKRARDLQKARDAGTAPGATDGPAPTAFDRWGAAEAEHALRQDAMAAYHARKGMPGALDSAIDAVVVAMDGTVSREQAEQLVIAAAAFRGKKPVPPSQ